MSQAAVSGSSDGQADVPANVTLRGTTRGLEILIAGSPTAAALGARLSELLAEAPAFFAGSHARVAIEGLLPVGALACLEEVAARFELRLVEIGPAASKRPRGELTPLPSASQPVLLATAAAPSALPPASLATTAAPSALPPIPPIPSIPSIPPGPPVPSMSSTPSGSSIPPIPPIPGAAAASAPGAAEDVPVAELAEGTGRIAEDGKLATKRDPELLAALAAVLVAAGQREAAAAAEAAIAVARAVAEARAAEVEVDTGPRLVIGPLRSGRIVDHPGHLIVIGDVNPGAEVRAEGSIIVLGRLRGVAHAAIGRDAGCIIALSLQPQQLRIGRMVARAGDADRPGGGAEIAYATGETIVVERFLGRLPSGLAASM